MEKIFSDLKNSVNSAVKRSGELLEISKVKMAVADTKNEIGRKYRELGEKVYESHQEDADTATEVEGIIWELDELFEVLKSHEMKLASVKTASSPAKWRRHIAASVEQNFPNRSRRKRNNRSRTLWMKRQTKSRRQWRK